MIGCVAGLVRSQGMARKHDNEQFGLIRSSLIMAWGHIMVSDGRQIA